MCSKQHDLLMVTKTILAFPRYTCIDREHCIFQTFLIFCSVPSADLDTQAMQLKHCDGEYCNY